MNESRWQQVESIFHQSLQLPPEERHTYISTACTDDEELRAEVISLLEADQEANKVIDRLHDDLALLADLDSFSGTTFGPYKLIRLIGSGGMGSVYLAYRVEGDFEQQVAIKLLRQGVASEAALKRFRQERQILSNLAHPNIARLLDGGLKDSSWPWFAMEYVQGEAIDDYCETHQLSIDERLDLFRQVCDAVQYSHANLIVHRDLKPGNILVTTNRTVKLLDFGIAKMVTESDNHLETTLTQSPAMTLKYASPEQVRREAISTASDIYSLGVVLYELLCGAHISILKVISRDHASNGLCPSYKSANLARQNQLTCCIILK
jgi:serine/threonine-protein kinase